ncbi:MAG: hypothetical protein OXC97_04465 [Candidatus Dadabacteria bacterium]|nr:hypothetical protein [Candidatus Dadabacteria bacterium]
MADRNKKLAEIRENFEAFETFLPSIKQKYIGEFAVLREKQIVDYFDSMEDAVKYADTKYENGVYSIQQVDNRIVDLGYFFPCR